MQAQQQRPILSANRDRKPVGKKPFVAKGHDAILKGLQDSGDSIEVTLINYEGVVRGTLVARDKFTITVKTNEGKRRTFFKHAIESFGPEDQVQ